MPKTNFTKIKLLKLWEILSVGSDEDYPLSTSEIIEKLKNQGVECDRRTLYEDIRDSANAIRKGIAIENY